MGALKKLAQQTAVYGVSSILQRFITFLIFPYISRVASPTEYGVYVELLTYTALLNIILTYGLETGFFRFANQFNPDKVFSTSLMSIIATSISFFSLFFVFRHDIAESLDYNEYLSYLFLVVIVIILDAFLAIPYAKLRFQEKALRFSMIKLLNVVVMVAFTMFFISGCPFLIEKWGWKFLEVIYNPDFLVGYVLLAYVVASFISLLLLIPEIFSVKFNFDFSIWKKLMLFSLPILVSQLAGFLPDSVDKLMLKHLDTSGDPLVQLGDYGANLKFASMVIIAVQMFRYAAEPFFFAAAKNSNAKLVYADIIKYVSIFGVLIFVGISFNMPILKYIVGADFRDSLNVVDIVIFGYVMYALFYSLSAWYKVSDNTHLAIIFTGVGALVTIVGNYFIIPLFGYTGSAWIRVLTYSVMVLLSYGFSLHYYKMPIQLLRIAMYFSIGLFLVFIASNLSFDSVVKELLLKNSIIIMFVLFIAWNENILQMVKKRFQ
ncbi:MAG: oligosaccharide flippase family protein [Bacteroidales bacterium]|nr:oligosaccharide flippase family protein [Bacteroidales bacterium]